MGLSFFHTHPTQARTLHGFPTACFSIHRGGELSLFLNWVEFRRELPKWLNRLERLVHKERWKDLNVCNLAKWQQGQVVVSTYKHSTSSNTRTGEKQSRRWRGERWKHEKKTVSRSFCLSVSPEQPPQEARDILFLGSHPRKPLPLQSYGSTPTAGQGGETSPPRPFHLY